MVVEGGHAAFDGVDALDVVGEGGASEGVEIVGEGFCLICRPVVVNCVDC